MLTYKNAVARENFNRLAVEHGGGGGSPRMTLSARVAGRPPVPGRSVFPADGVSTVTMVGMGRQTRSSRVPAVRPCSDFGVVGEVSHEHGDGRQCGRLTRSARAFAHGAVPAVFFERCLAKKSVVRLEKY